jgi:hypothetical protein
VASRAHCIGGGLSIKIKLRQCFLNALWHLGDDVLVFWGNHTGRIRKCEVQDDINETHNKIAIIATDIDNDTAEYSEEDGNLGNGIKFLDGGGKVMLWVVLSVWWSFGSR